MRMPSHNTLCSFVFSLLLTSAMIPSTGNVSLAAAGAPAAQMAAQAVLNGLRTQGLAAGSEVALPTPAATPAAATPASVTTPAASLTPDTMAKMSKLIADKGIDRDLPAVVANTLGLTDSGKTWASRSITWGESNGTNHAFYVSRTADQDLVVSLEIPGKSVNGYRTRRDGTVISAFTFDASTRQITMRTPDEAQASFDVQAAFWTSLVNRPVSTASN